MSSFENVDLPAPFGPQTNADVCVRCSDFVVLAMSAIALFHSGGEFSSCMMLLLGASSEVQSYQTSASVTCLGNVHLTIRNVSSEEIDVSSEPF